MPTPTQTNIPNVTYNSYFGNIGKVVWFEVSENYNYFELYFSINLQQSKKTSLTLYNNLTTSYVWENQYPADANQETYLDSVKILYVPQVGSEQPFGLINLPT